MKGTEFSKKIFNIVITLFIIVIAYSMALMWHTMDTSALSYLIPSVSGLVTATISFYFWKAKGENLLKIRQSMRDMDMETEDIDAEIDELKNESLDAETY